MINYYKTQINLKKLNDSEQCFGEMKVSYVVLKISSLIEDFM